MIDKTHAKVWFIEDFVTAEECAVLMDFGEHYVSDLLTPMLFYMLICAPIGRPRLKRATVVALNGSNVESSSRKAYNAGTFMHDDDKEKIIMMMIMMMMIMMYQQISHHLYVVITHTVSIYALN